MRHAAVLGTPRDHLDRPPAYIVGQLREELEKLAIVPDAWREKRRRKKKKKMMMKTKRNNVCVWSSTRERKP